MDLFHIDLFDVYAFCALTALTYNLNLAVSVICTAPDGVVLLVIAFFMTVQVCLPREALGAFVAAVGFFRSLAQIAHLVVAIKPFFTCIYLAPFRCDAAQYMACMVNLVLPVQASSLCSSL